jgi:hypothetical protein
MSIRRVVPDITCNQIHESRKFYTGFLGFDVAMDMDWVVTLVSPCNPTDEPWGVRRFFVKDPNSVVINVMSHHERVVEF